jgi:hypothetical protein
LALPQREVWLVQFISYYLKSGSGRVLDCSRVTAEIQEADEKPANLLFRTGILNRCLLIKDIYISRNRLGETIGAQVKTKIYLPFDPKQVADGGQTVFFDTPEFTRAMANLIDMKDEDRRGQYLTDHSTLIALDSLPTFAPFLLKDRLEQAGIKANPRYYDLPEEEWKETFLFVQSRFEKILRAVLPGDNQTPQRLQLLLSRLWDFSDPATLAPLSAVLHIEPSKMEEVFYSWKGVIFFSYEFTRSLPQINEFLGWIHLVSTVPALYPESRDEETLTRVTVIAASAEKIKRDIEEHLELYEQAFNDMFVDGSSAKPFTDFLLHAQGYFQSLGINLGRLLQGVEIWNRTSERFARRKMSPEVYRDLLRVLEDILTILQVDLIR